MCAESKSDTQKLADAKKDYYKRLHLHRMNTKKMSSNVSDISSQVSHDNDVHVFCRSLVMLCVDVAASQVITAFCN